MKRTKAILTTDFEKDLGAIPFADYPRPQMRRDSYVCLNGAWDFRVERRGKTRVDGRITVPFPPESRLSGVGMRVGKRDLMIYERTFTLPPDFVRGRVLLHIGACDYRTDVYALDGTLLLSYSDTDAQDKYYSLSVLAETEDSMIVCYLNADTMLESYACLLK